MLDIEETIDAIQKRPGMFLDELRLDYVFYFLLGTLSEAPEGSKNYSFKVRFHDSVAEWIAFYKESKYETEGMFWYKMLYDHCSNEEDALRTFFEICESFFGDYKKDNTKR